MAEHKKQHFVPECYLKAWCDPDAPEGQEPYVWLFSRDASNGRRKAPTNIFHETDLYTIEVPGGGRNLVLERRLSQLESKFVAIRDTKLQRLEPLDQDEHAVLCVFIAAMHGRTPAQRDHLSQQWGKALALMDRMIEWSNTATPEQKKRAASTAFRPNREQSLTYEEVKALVEKPLQTAMLSFIRAEAPLLARLDCAVFTWDRDGFITSDAPCVWFDAEACKRPPFFQSPGLMYESIEITLPISPRQTIVLNRRGLTGYLPAFEKLVDEFNRRTCAHCAEFFVNNQNETRPIWFDPGVEPADSWRRQHEAENLGQGPTDT